VTNRLSHSTTIYTRDYIWGETSVWKKMYMQILGFKKMKHADSLGYYMMRDFIIYIGYLVCSVIFVKFRL
jgi:hypothetical protein